MFHTLLVVRMGQRAECVRLDLVREDYVVLHYESPSFKDSGSIMASYDVNFDELVFIQRVGSTPIGAE